MRVQEVRPQWRIRLLHEDGDPLANREVMVQQRTWRDYGGSYATLMSLVGSYLTEDNGTLVFPFSDELEGDRMELAFTVGPHGHERFAYGTVEILPTFAGQDQDFGDHLLQGPTLLASGNVRDADGNPVKAELSLHQYRDLKIGEFEKVAFEVPPALHIVQGETGEFQCFAIANSDRFELQVEPVGGLIEARDFYRGANDLDFVVEPESFVKGRLAIPDGFLAEDFRIRFYTGVEELHPNHGMPTPDAIPEPDGRFQLRALEPGQVGAVGVIYEPSRALIVGIKGIETTQDAELQDPRLHPIDLAGLTHATIKVSSPHNSYIGSIHYKVLSPESGVNPMEIYVHSDEFGITSLHPEVEIWLEVHDHARKYLTVTSGHHEVKLSKARTVLLELEAPPLKEGYSWRAKTRLADASPFEGDTHKFPANWQVGFRVPIKLTGDHVLQLSLVKEERRSFGMKEWKTDFQVPVEGPITPIAIQVTEAQLLDAYLKLDQPLPHH